MEQDSDMVEDEKDASEKSELEDEQKRIFAREDGGEAFDVDEEDENTCRPFGLALDDSDTENASLESNRGSDISEFRYLMDDVDVSNRSTGSPESVQGSVPEIGKAFDGFQEDNEVTGSVNSSIESEKKSLSSSISTGTI